MTGVEQQSVGADKPFSVLPSKMRQSGSGDGSFVAFMSIKDSSTPKGPSAPAVAPAPIMEQTDIDPVQPQQLQSEESQTLPVPLPVSAEAPHPMTAPFWASSQPSEVKALRPQGPVKEPLITTGSDGTALILPQAPLISQNEATALSPNSPTDPTQQIAVAAPLVPETNPHPHFEAVANSTAVPTEPKGALAPVAPPQKPADIAVAKAPLAENQRSPQISATPRDSVMRAYLPPSPSKPSQLPLTPTDSAATQSVPSFSGPPVLNGDRKIITPQQVQSQPHIPPAQPKTGVIAAAVAATSPLGPISSDTLAQPSPLNSKLDFSSPAPQPTAPFAANALAINTSTPIPPPIPNPTIPTPTPSFGRSVGVDILTSAPVLAQKNPEPLPTLAGAQTEKHHLSAPMPPVGAAQPVKFAQVPYGAKISYVSGSPDATSAIENAATSDAKTTRASMPEAPSTNLHNIAAPEAAKRPPLAAVGPPQESLQEPMPNPKSDMTRLDVSPMTSAPPPPQANTSVPPLHQPIAYQNQAPITVPALTQLITERAQSGKPSTIELTLAPDELGKIKLILIPDGDKVRVVIHAERPETMDLMRRNTESFIADLRNAGFNNPSFSFANWGDAPKSGSRQKQNASHHPASAGFVAPQLSTTHHIETSRTGLDLRV